MSVLLRRKLPEDVALNQIRYIAHNDHLQIKTTA
jgi:hypothetical protein